MEGLKRRRRCLTGGSPVEVGAEGSSKGACGDDVASLFMLYNAWRGSRKSILSCMVYLVMSIMLFYRRESVLLLIII